MDVATLSIAMVLTVTSEELAILEEAAKRNGVSVEELIKTHIVSLCGGVNPCS